MIQLASRFTKLVSRLHNHEAHIAASGRNQINSHQGAENAEKTTTRNVPSLSALHASAYTLILLSTRFGAVLSFISSGIRSPGHYVSCEKRWLCPLRFCKLCSTMRGEAVAKDRLKRERTISRESIEIKARCKMRTANSYF